MIRLIIEKKSQLFRTNKDFPFSLTVMELCRLCGTEIVAGTRRYAKTDNPVKSWISRAFDVDIAADPSSFPHHICDCCRRKLSRWNTQVSRNKKVTLNIKLQSFEADEDKPAPTPTQFSEVIAEATGIATQRRYQKWEQPNQDVFFVSFNPATLAVDRSVCIRSDRTWQISTHGKQQTPSLHPMLNNVPEQLTSAADITTVFDAASGTICVGNPDFPSLMSKKTRNGRDGNVQSLVEQNGPYGYRGTMYQATIRKTTCTFLAASDGQFPVCKLYRTDLQAAMSYERNRPNTVLHTDALSHVKHANMDTDELKDKLKNVQTERRRLHQRNQMLQKQLASLIETESVHLTGDDGELQEIMSEVSPSRRRQLHEIESCTENFSGSQTGQLTQLQ